MQRDTAPGASIRVLESRVPLPEPPIGWGDLAPRQSDTRSGAGSSEVRRRSNSSAIRICSSYRRRAFHTPLGRREIFHYCVARARKYLNTDGGVATPSRVPNAWAVMIVIFPRRGSGDVYRAEFTSGMVPSSVYRIVGTDPPSKATAGSESHALDCPRPLNTPPEGDVVHAPAQPPLTTPSKDRAVIGLRYNNG